MQLEHPELLEQEISRHPTLQELLPHQAEVMAKVGQLAAAAGAFVAAQMTALAKGTAGFFMLLFIMLLAMFHFLIDGQSILDAALRHTPLTSEDKSRLLGTFASVGRATVKGTLVIGILDGALAGLALWVAGIDGALFWAAVMTVLSVIPGIGTGLVWIPAVVFLAIDGRIAAAAGVMVWCGVIIGLVDNVVRPKLVGKDTKMPDLLILLTTLGGLAVFGIPGLLVGPIIGALFMTVWQRWGAATDEARGNAAVVAAPDGDEKAG
jgi:predicted PurR-regulated permease PerM